MENSQLVIFGEIWPKSLYYIVQGLWPDFGVTLKIHKKSNFDRNHLKTCYATLKHVYVSGKDIKMENPLLVIFGEIWPKSLYYSTGTLARFWSNFKNS